LLPFRPQTHSRLLLRVSADLTRFFLARLSIEQVALNLLDDVFLQNLAFEGRSAFSKVSPSWMCFFRYGISLFSTVQELTDAAGLAERYSGTARPPMPNGQPVGDMNEANAFILQGTMSLTSHRGKLEFARCHSV
jgi:hypothetical protein